MFATDHENIRILVAEDRLKTADLMRRALEGDGHSVLVAYDGDRALTLGKSAELDVILLDVMLPRLDGFSVLRKLREARLSTAVIIVSARDTLPEIVRGLDSGADDYLTKPFEPRELLARIKSVMRRMTQSQGGNGSRLRMGRRVLDLERRILVDIDSGFEESLTASEFDLLKVFAENPNRPLNRDWLFEVIAHREMDALDRAIDLRVTRLRKKIEADPSHPDAIRTVRGVGYMFVPPKD